MAGSRAPWTMVPMYLFGNCLAAAAPGHCQVALGMGGVGWGGVGWGWVVVFKLDVLFRFYFLKHADRQYRTQY